MKRALTLMLTVVVVGGLMFMGAAGTAAAQDVDLGGDGGDGGDAGNWAEVNQQNNNAQIGIAEASATGAADHNDHEKKAYDNGDTAGTSASASVSQAQDVDQSNTADINQEATAGDGGDGGAVDINVDLNLGEILNDEGENDLPALFTGF